MCLSLQRIPQWRISSEASPLCITPPCTAAHASPASCWSPSTAATSSTARATDGWTPLHVAATTAATPSCGSSGVKAEVTRSVTKSPRRSSWPSSASAPAVRILLDHSANIDIQNGFLLRYAVIKGNHSYCRMFLQRGADTNLGRLEDGQTPLHLSALRDDVLCAQMLYTYGADTNTRNYEGQTPVAVSVSMSGISRPCLDFLQEVTSRFTFSWMLIYGPASLFLYGKW